MEINERIHAELQGTGLVRGEEHRVRTLVPRQDLTGADRTWAARYEVGDVLRYSRASRETGIGKGQYAQVQSVDAAINRLTVKLRDGTERTYDPRRQRGVSVFRAEKRRFSVGDRIQFTAPANELKIANRELGVIRDIDGAGRLNLKMDSGRSLQIDPNEHPHLDYGYAMTSHSSQGQTANRVLIHVDTELAAKDLLNNRMAYVSISRGAFDAQLFTNDREKLPTALGHVISKQTAHSVQIDTEQTTAPQQEISGRKQDHSTGFGIGL
jgi:ATP-dependent exoDNAse (exonuclease V) alpha subunit